MSEMADVTVGAVLGRMIYGMSTVADFGWTVLVVGISVTFTTALKLPPAGSSPRQ